MPPKSNKPLLLYLSAAHESLGCMLAQEDEGVERAVYYESTFDRYRNRYTDIEKICLCLYFTCCKLRYNMLSVVVYVMSQTDIIKAVKGQVLADFLSDHPYITLEEEKVNYVDETTWRMWFDGSRTSQGAGAGVHIISPLEALYKVSFTLNFECTNNQAEYEALTFGLEILAKLGATTIQVWGDSLLVIKQVIGEFKCESELLVRLEYTERPDNFIANDLAQHSSGYMVNLQFDSYEREASNLYTGGITIEERNFLLYQLDVTQNWRTEILKWLEKPDLTNRRLRTLALNYVVLAGELYKKGFEGLLFRCIGPKEAILTMAEVHKGITGAHQAGPRMRWLIHKYGFYWPKMEQDCIRYAKGCEVCQKCGPIQHVPVEQLHSTIKP
ncbi:uncharacterized protein LOC126668318 [Mercurialis annua]|uniref:uncharacterized protein LOC126668318 n=1 Tax=Mercurialis annua TaxID=3986 RepID=UPI00215E4784|nr:uncharacterized protein LOC126668318 [Mercurialis annua]